MTDLDYTVKTAKELVGSVISGYHSVVHNAPLYKVYKVPSIYLMLNKHFADFSCQTESNFNEVNTI